jgi:hypothetical protein
MAAFLNRALHLPPTNKDFFTDDEGSVFEGDINKLAASGITKGCNPPANTMYCPHGKVTRGQMAAFLVRAFGYSDDGGGNLFVDDDHSIFEGAIDRLGTAGVTKGCNPPTNNRYCPDAPVQRDQMASFLTRALGLRAQTPSHDHSTQHGPNLDLIGAADDAGCNLADDGKLDTCKVKMSMPGNTEFWVFEGFYRPDWSRLTQQERAEAMAELRRTEFRLTLNGARLQVEEFLFVDSRDDTLNRLFNFQFPAWLRGTHRIVGEWIDHGVTDLRVTADVNCGGA